MSKFYVVATPIGNLEDITLRAIRVLKEVDVIFCEDTRTTRVLLEKYGIKTPTESYHAKSSKGKSDRILKLLEEGKNLALVSDAGTPAISDPGVLIVSQIKEKFGHYSTKATTGEGDVQIIPIPGPSALVALLSAAGVPGNEFTFLGFLPHKKGRETIFKEIAVATRPMVFYESTHRILKALESLKKYAPEKKLVVGRELTKLFEEIKTGTAAEILEYFNQNKDKVRGEFTVIVV